MPARITVPSLFHSILPLGTELLPFCTSFLFPLFLIFTALVQILTPATDFCPSPLQHQKITENSKIQGSQFWHCHTCAECLQQQVSLVHVPLSCSQVQYPGSAESFCMYHILPLSWSLYIHYHLSCLINIKGPLVSLRLPGSARTGIYSSFVGILPAVPSCSKKKSNSLNSSVLSDLLIGMQNLLWRLMTTPALLRITLSSIIFLINYHLLRRSMYNFGSSLQYMLFLTPRIEWKKVLKSKTSKKTHQPKGTLFYSRYCCCIL